MAVSESVETQREAPRRPAAAPGGAVDAGMAAGLFAGLVMALAGMLVSAAQGAGLWTPMRLLAASVLGVDALIGGFGAVLLGVLLHFFAAALWGVLFTALVDRELAADRALALGLVYGVAVWLIMTYAALPALDPVMAARVALSPGEWFLMHLVYGACLWRAPAFKRRTMRL